MRFNKYIKSIISAAVLFTDGVRFLSCKPTNLNYWEIPKGTTDGGELPINAAIREFKEETGLKLIDPKLKMIVLFDNRGRILGQKQNPEDWLVQVYQAEDYTGELKEEKPTARLVWVENSDYLKLKVHEGDKKIWELLNQPGIFEVVARYDKEELISFDYVRV